MNSDQSLFSNVTSHAKTYTNGFLFSNGNPFTSRFSPVPKKFASVRTAWAIRLKRKSSRSNGCVIRSQKLPNRSNGQCTRSEKFASVRAVWSSVHKNHPSVRTACAIRSEKLSIRSNGCGTRSEKFESVRTTWSSVQKNYPPVQNCNQLEPFIQTPWIIINFTLFRWPYAVPCGRSFAKRRHEMVVCEILFQPCFVAFLP